MVTRTAHSGQPIHVGGRVVGYVRGDVFFKTIRGSRHLLQRPRALAFDVSTLYDAQRAGARFVQVADAESGAVYRASIADVLDRGFRFNRGYGDQIGWPLDSYTRRDRGEQLSLFAAGGAL